MSEENNSVLEQMRQTMKTSPVGLQGAVTPSRHHTMMDGYERASADQPIYFDEEKCRKAKQKKIIIAVAAAVLIAIGIFVFTRLGVSGNILF